MWKRIKNFISRLFGSSGDIIPLASGGSGNPISPEASCVAHYKMNDDAFNYFVIDSKGYSNGEARQKTEDLAVDGKIGGALSFNGTSDYIDTNDAFLSTFRDSFSVNLWCKANDGITGISQFLFSIDAVAPNTQVNILIGATGNLRCFYAADSPVITAHEDVSSFIDGINDWKMITMVVTQVTATTGNVALYVNGLLRKQGTTGNVDFTTYNTAFKPYLGVYNRLGDGSNNFFDGDIDNVMIFNKALNTEEISILYNSGRGTENFQLSPQLNMVGTALEMAVV